MGLKAKIGGRTVKPAVQTPDTQKDNTTHIGDFVDPFARGIGEVPDEKQAKRDAKDMYDRQAEKEDLTNAEDDQRHLENAYDTRVMDNIYGQWDWNLGKNNPTGNLNNMSFNRTLDMSRLADAFNNRLYHRADPRGIGNVHFSGESGGARTGSSGTWEKHEINTEEMRQMERNRSLDEKQRGRQIGRAEDVQDYRLGLRKQGDTAFSEAAKQEATNNIDWGNFLREQVFNEKYVREYETRLTKAVQEYVQNLPYHLKTVAADYIIKFGLEERTLLTALMNAGTPFSQQNRLMSQALDRIENMDMSPDERRAVMKFYGISDSVQNINMLNDNLTGGLPSGKAPRDAGFESRGSRR